MIAVAEVLRHRGTTKGFYGLMAKHANKEPLWVWKLALMAWNLSATTNLTKWATNFENVNRFGWPSWAVHMRVVAVIGDHVFLK